ncbi:hypothetical protein SBOR_2377 [Sclerotinia borealis F-4128]|uniref:Alpha/beta hydrolase fold-3 domain-containing protein n=1 Tax=Sclerotinia borealis (strain F-4128) TaxID=1432307 RepID=W9CRN8_SCLBF|nr:hypothetical protein SBOR_2377 [Sclerotinia borealis F-4128]
MAPKKDKTSDPVDKDPLSDSSDLFDSSPSPQKDKFKRAPNINNDPEALAARLEPVVINLPRVVSSNLTPYLGAGIHVVNTESTGALCGLYAFIYSYSAARDLAAPAGTAVPLANNPTVQELIAFRGTQNFWDEAWRYVEAKFLTDKSKRPKTYKAKMDLTKLYIPDDPNNYEGSCLHVLLAYINKRYDTHYVLGSITQGFNVRWDPDKEIWDLAHQVATIAPEYGTGQPVVWLYNDNAQAEERSLHQSPSPVILNHWMGFSTLHRQMDRHLINITNTWFGDNVRKDVEAGVWIVTADIDGSESDQHIALSRGHFVREPPKDPAEDAPNGFTWLQRCPTFGADNSEIPGTVGLVPTDSIKRIEMNALRDAHDAAGVTAASIANKTGTKDGDDSLWLDFHIYRIIEPTSKIGRKYPDPNDAKKKFVDNFTFEDSEFLLDKRDPLKGFYPILTKLDGTSGLVKPRNLQKLEDPWGLPDRLPIESSNAKKDTIKPFEEGANVKDYTLKILKEECAARGIEPRKWGRTKPVVLATLIEHDKTAGDRLPPELPMRRVTADVAAQAGPPKYPPFFATEIVLEIGQGKDGDPALYVKDYEGRVGRINAENLTRIEGAWGVALDLTKWDKILNDIKKESKLNKLVQPVTGDKRGAGTALTTPAAKKQKTATTPVKKTPVKKATTPVKKADPVKSTPSLLFKENNEKEFEGRQDNKGSDSSLLFKRNTDHPREQIDSLDLKVDIIHPANLISISTAVLYLHGGGLTGFNRELLPPHIAQSCLLRNWPIVSADYRLMPQASAQDMLDDLISAYSFVHDNLRDILALEQGQNKKIDIILMGSSAGAYLSFLAKPYLSSPPIAVFTYYGCPTVHDPKKYFASNKTLLRETPYSELQFSLFLTSPPVIDPTPPFLPIFHPSSLLPDFSRDPAFQTLPEAELEDRSLVFLWLVQENKLPELWQGLDKGLESDAWKGFGKTIVVHGDQDELIPYYMAKEALDVIGSEDSQLFTAVGKGHAWDMSLFLGDPELKAVEEAWKALDEIVVQAKAGPPV